MSEYGALGGIVAVAGSVMAAGGAITLAFKGRARWEPIEEDVPKAPAKIAGLATAVCIVLIFIAARKNPDTAWLGPLCLGFLVTALVGIFGYIWLVQVNTFTAQLATGRRKVASQKVIGGLWLTRQARAVLHQPDEPKTVQMIFAGSAYNKDLVWPRPSQAVAKLLFLISFLALQVFGSLSLASAAILLDIVMGGST
jgi:hypothetical protein